MRRGRDGRPLELEYPQLKELKVLDRLVKLITSPDFAADFDLSRILLVVIQHLQPDTMGLLQGCIKAGIRHFFVSGKIYSTDERTIARRRTAGIEGIEDMAEWLADGNKGILRCFSGHREQYQEGKDFTEQFERDLVKLLEDANTYVAEHRPSINTVIILDDGAKGIKLLMDKSRFPALQECAIAAVEQTTNGLCTLYRELREKDPASLREIPVVAVASSCIKSTLEPPYITQVAIARLQALHDVEGFFHDPEANYGILGYGNIGSGITAWLTDTLGVSKERIFIRDLDPARRSVARTEGLQIADNFLALVKNCHYVIGGTGSNAFEKEWPRELSTSEQAKKLKMKEELRVILENERRTFICFSSGNHEFGTIRELLGEISENRVFKRLIHSTQTFEALDPTENLEWDGVKIVYGGYPVNFKEGPNPDQFFHMDPIMASLFGGIIQAWEYVQDQSPATRLPALYSPGRYCFVSLHPYLQQYNVFLWFKEWESAYHASLTEFCQVGLNLTRLRSFSRAEDIIPGSSYRHVDIEHSDWTDVGINYPEMSFFMRHSPKIRNLLFGMVNTYAQSFPELLARFSTDEEAVAPLAPPPETEDRRLRAASSSSPRLFHPAPDYRHPSDRRREAAHPEEAATAAPPPPAASRGHSQQITVALVAGNGRIDSFNAPHVELVGEKTIHIYPDAEGTKKKDFRP